ncbi:hypothetical protein PVAP13_5NG461940 [Panicum virgatum]|uniref:Uncharacterized protein n=1 Tax=Panicum virgatum TaxID=38727 RepID=A0A8T0RW91_PANVG|nr:hypothetical protein PVAP13_5NG461940 [Panicum virgatum]
MLAWPPSRAPPPRRQGNRVPVPVPVQAVPLPPGPGCVARGGGHLPRQAAPAYSHPPARTRPRSMRVFLSPRALVPALPPGRARTLRACRSMTRAYPRIHRKEYAACACACAPWAVARLTGSEADSASARTGTAGSCAVACLPRHKSQRRAPALHARTYDRARPMPVHAVQAAERPASSRVDAFHPCLPGISRLVRPCRRLAASVLTTH